MYETECLHGLFYFLTENTVIYEFHTLLESVIEIFSSVLQQVYLLKKIIKRFSQSSDRFKLRRLYILHLNLI